MDFLLPMLLKLQNKNWDLALFINADVTNLTTFRLKSKAHLIEVYSVDTLKKVVSFFKDENQKYFVIGWGANLILKEQVLVPLIKLKFPWDDSIFDGKRLEFEIPASVSIASLVSKASHFGILGWEVLTGIPASLGGAIFMNAGTSLGEICTIIKSVNVITSTGEEKLIKVIGSGFFSYRKNLFLNEGDIVVGATLYTSGYSSEVGLKIRKYLELRNKSQPMSAKTCGCIFKNYFDSKTTISCRAGFFVDIIGLKGFTNGKIAVSAKHANFLENKGEASYTDALEVITAIQEELLLQYGIKFEIEALY